MGNRWYRLDAKKNKDMIQPIDVPVYIWAKNQNDARETYKNIHQIYSCDPNPKISVLSLQQSGDLEKIISGDKESSIKGAKSRFYTTNEHFKHIKFLKF